MLFYQLLNAYDEATKSQHLQIAALPLGVGLGFVCLVKQTIEGIKIF